MYFPRMHARPLWYRKIYTIKNMIQLNSKTEPTVGLSVLLHSKSEEEQTELEDEL